VKDAAELAGRTAGIRIIDQLYVDFASAKIHQLWDHNDASLSRKETKPCREQYVRHDRNTGNRAFVEYSICSGGHHQSYQSTGRLKANVPSASCFITQDRNLEGYPRTAD
jgi:hypothetical protein